MTNLHGTKFGIEIEFVADEPYYRIGERVAELAGTAFNGWEIKSEGLSSEWGEYGCEAVSDVMTYSDDAIRRLYSVVMAIAIVGGRVNDGCGIHVHVDGDEVASGAQIRNLVLKMHRVEALMKVMVGTAAHRDEYCAELDAETVARFRDSKVTTREEAAEAWYGDDAFCTWQERAEDRWDITRYQSLNVHSVFYRNSVEYRLFNSAVDPDEVKAYVDLALAFTKSTAAKVRVRSARLHPANKLVSARRFLRNLGLAGKAFKTTRECLTRRLVAGAAQDRAA